MTTLFNTFQNSLIEYAGYTGATGGIVVPPASASSSQFTETILSGATGSINIPISNAISTIQVFITYPFFGGINYGVEAYLTDTISVSQGGNFILAGSDCVATKNIYVYATKPVNRISSTLFYNGDNGNNNARGPAPVYIFLQRFSGFPIGTIVGVHTT